MLANCDKCGQEFEVNEARLPHQGARMKCTSCGNIFLVRPGHSQVSAVSPIVEDQQPAPAAPPVEEEPPWKVSHLGLTYTFHDLTALRNWLSGRSSLDDVKVAKGEDDWKELGDYPDVLSAELITKFFPLGDVPTTKSKTLSGGVSAPADIIRPSLVGITPVTQTSMVLNKSVQSKNARQIQKQREKAEKEKKESTKQVILFAIGCAIIVSLVVVSVVSAVTGNIPFMSSDKPEPVAATATSKPSTPAPPTPSANVNTPQANDSVEKRMEDLTPEEREAIKAQALADLLREEEEKLNNRLKEAREMISNKQWPEARATLESLNQERPNHLETLQLLTQTYRGLGLNDKVEETVAEVKRVLAEEKKQEAAAEDMVFGEE